MHFDVPHWQETNDWEYFNAVFDHRNKIKLYRFQRMIVLHDSPWNKSLPNSGAVLINFFTRQPNSNKIPASPWCKKSLLNFPLEMWWTARKLSAVETLYLIISKFHSYPKSFCISFPYSHSIRVKRRHPEITFADPLSCSAAQTSHKQFRKNALMK